ncbi:hypothetical protein [Actinophytocola oryzae]|uniref:Uncharacterized protein n=1 Tax=Actinophytocola oryzae TaxID=502181 RepID=A0A4R7UNQ9_9PSEU|nr:hypothetical protein [Actinophytocola oryzae]TDV34587.1 hypothetical protein CLV71_1382 [Actinophytocola oryzae]
MSDWSDVMTDVLVRIIEEQEAHLTDPDFDWNTGTDLRQQDHR